jgi:dTDP-4-amino-4,6-dideoxygalactose transaminase
MIPKVFSNDPTVSNIPPLDLKRQYQTIGSEVNEAVAAVLASGAYIGGPNVQNFEREFAEYIGSTECVGCNSGTDALYLALKVLKIGPGDEVITTPFTFIATAETISAVGAKPVLVDVDPQTYNIDLNLIEAAITPRTKAIMPVHLFGRPVNMTALMAIADRHQIKVIEDCAQSTGATCHIGCFSFFPTKNLGGVGDGGAVTLNDANLAADLRMYREHGSRVRYYHEVIGINSRLDALQATVLSIKLRYLDKWNQQRAVVAQQYQEMLSGVAEVALPQAGEGGNSVWNQYTIRILGAADQGERRDKVRAKLQESGVISMIYYPLPLHLQQVYQDLGYQAGDFPVTEEISHQVLSLPMFPELSIEEQQRVVYALKEALTL